ncbi:hypothetical protein AYL99_01030 [Fonsecaea erecta]|uniref:Zn(2)-C6 fungal-type domain-containing protein n=1 Tax=Fonsecaea erecta TaxID=1367422 RepID=A0A178ZZ04_9EURO|nr:hypothetical protein AYL99_01030 [Fonsecaea erecta]OAP65058.1 hypothetical protein AYL99_01030 [Fonsecaea erecta]
MPQLQMQPQMQTETETETAAERQASRRDRLKRKREGRVICKACTVCRIRKTKCDGQRPRCGTCLALQVDCQYLEDTRRQPRPSWSTVQNLEATIASLLKQVNSHQEDSLTSPGLSSDAQRISDGSPSANTLSVSDHNRNRQRTSGTADTNLHNGSGAFEFLDSRHVGPALFPPRATPNHLQSNLDDPSQVRSHGEGGLEGAEESVTEDSSGLSPSEAQIAGLFQHNGKVSVHGISSFLHQSGSHAAPDKADSTLNVPCRRHNEAASARLISNASIQRQREPYLFRGPRLSIDFDGVDPEMAKHLLDLHWNRQHYAFLLTYRPAIMGGLFNNGPYVNKLLLNAIYYSSCQYSDRTEILRSEPDDLSTCGIRFYDRFRSLLVEEIVNPSIPTATALLLCGATLVSHGKPSAGWILCGIAYRMVIDLGCHLVTDARLLSAEVPSDRQILTDMEREMRKRIYWGAFITDATQSLYLGRKPILHNSDARVPLMLLDTFEELEEWTPYLDPQSQLGDASMMSLSNYQPKPAYAVSTFQAQARLFQISAKITRAFYGIDSIAHSSHYLREARQQIMQELDDWNAALPIYLHFRPGLDPVPPPHQLTPHTSYRTLNILVQRPFLANGHLKKHSDADEKAEGERICLEAALAISKLIKAYRATFTLRRAPYLLSYAAYSAAVVLLHKGNAERTQLKGEIIFFWTALCELQRGCNFGLHKPLSVLRQMMRELGEESVSFQTEDGGGSNSQVSRMLESSWTAAEERGGGELLNHHGDDNQVCHGARFAGNNYSHSASMSDNNVDFGAGPASLFTNDHHQGLMDVWDEDARNIYDDMLFGLFAPPQHLH